MTTIANKVALAMVNSDQAVIVDVREPAEFWDGHLPAAVNLPSTRFQVESYHDFSDRAVCLVCQTGRRAAQVATTLKQQGISDVFLLEHQMAELADTRVDINSPPAGWTIDRQFRMTLGLLLAIFLLGYFLWSTAFIVIPIVLCVGLIVTSTIDRCYLRTGIAMLPWNRSRINELSERNAYRHTALSDTDVR